MGRRGSNTPALRPDQRRSRRGSRGRRSGEAGLEGTELSEARGELFTRLGSAGHIPFLEKASGSLRFELVEGRKTDRWLIHVDKGDVEVKHKGGEADCVVRADRKVFEGVIAGRVNAFAAVLRGAVTVEGDPTLLVLLQRLLPSPPNRKGPA